MTSLNLVSNGVSVYWIPTITGTVTIDVSRTDPSPTPTPPGPGPVSHGPAVPINVNSVTYNHVSNSPSLAHDILPTVYLIQGITDTASQDRWTTGIMTAALRESSYDFNAVNNTDSNAIGPIQADGSHFQCSRGVLQCIPQTFAAYHEPGTSANIYDAVANVCAAMNYVHSRYGVSWDASNLASNVSQFDPNRPGGGY